VYGLLVGLSSAVIQAYVFFMPMLAGHAVGWMSRARLGWLPTLLPPTVERVAKCRLMQRACQSTGIVLAAFGVIALPAALDRDVTPSVLVLSMSLDQVAFAPYSGPIACHLVAVFGDLVTGIVFILCKHVSLADVSWQDLVTGMCVHVLALLALFTAVRCWIWNTSRCARKHKNKQASRRVCACHTASGAHQTKRK